MKGEGSGMWVKYITRRRGAELPPSSELEAATGPNGLWMGQQKTVALNVNVLHG
jgi:hypothetical protein